MLANFQILSPGNLKKKKKKSVLIPSIKDMAAISRKLYVILSFLFLLVFGQTL